MVRDRESLIVEFLNNNDLGNASRIKLASDASFRRYERISSGDRALMLMDAPPEKEKPKEFIYIGNFLNESGFSAPQIYASDEKNGFILLEDIGDDSFSNVLSGKSDLSSKFSELELYLAAMDVLIALRSAPIPDKIPAYSPDILIRECKLLTDWYLPNLVENYASDTAEQEYEDIWKELVNFKKTGPDVVVLRDYHADNLMWLPQRPSVKNVGLLDFQDALIGSPLYDIISLLEDARRDVSAKTVESCIKHYLAASPGIDKEEFMAEYALLAAQRNCKIVGIFARLAIRDGKERYLNYLPRVWGHLENDLKHPSLKKLKEWMDKEIPAQMRKPQALKLAKKEYVVCK